MKTLFRLKQLFTNSLLLIKVFILCTTPLFALAEDNILDISQETQPFWDFAFTTQAGIFSPTGHYKQFFEQGKGITAKLQYNPKLIDTLLINAEFSYYFGKFKENNDYFYYLTPMSIGPAFQIPIWNDLYATAEGSAGIYILHSPIDKYSNPFFKFEAGLSYEILTNFSAGISSSYNLCLDSQKNLTGFINTINLQYAFGEPLAQKDIMIEQVSIEPVFLSISKSYIDKAAIIAIKNTSDKVIKDIKISLEIKGKSSKSYSNQIIANLPANNQANFACPIIFPQSNLESVKSNNKEIITLEAEYILDKKKYIKREIIKSKLYNINTINWENPLMLGAFTTFENPAIKDLAIKAVKNKIKSGFQENIDRAMKIFMAVKSLGVSYLPDPKNVNSGIDSINFPIQTLIHKGGDCDDLSVLFASLFEAVGISTAYILLSDHVLIMFEIKDPVQVAVEYSGRFWVPLEATLIKEGFFQAWAKGFDLFNRAKKKTILLTLKAIKTFEPFDYNKPVQVALNEKSISLELISEMNKINTLANLITPAELIQMANDQYKKENYKIAEFFYLAALNHMPDNQTILENLIKLYITIEKKEKAEFYNAQLAKVLKETTQKLDRKIKNLK